jgi:hypothetical protein
MAIAIERFHLAGMLAVGFIANSLVRPLGERWFMKEDELVALRAKSQQGAVAGSMGIGQWRLDATSVAAWLAVGVPIAWGVYVTLTKALVLFH